MGPELAARHHLRLSRDGGALVRARPQGRLRAGAAVFVDPTDFFRLFRFELSAATP